MHAAFQFDLARSSGHSEGCHHRRLLQSRVNAVRQILHSGMPTRDIYRQFGFAWLYQITVSTAYFAFGSHALNKASLFVLQRTQTQTPSLVMLSCKSWRPRKFNPLVDSHTAKTDSFDWNSSLLRFYYRFYRCQKGLGGVHSDISAANICNLRQWRSQQPSCFYIETCSSFCLLRAQLEVSNTSPFVWPLYLALVWLWYFECERLVCPWDSPCSVNWYAHKQNHQLWLEQSKP